VSGGQPSWEDADAPFEETATVLRRDPRILGLAAMPVALALAWFTAARPATSFDFWVDSVLASVLLFWMIWAINPAARTRRMLVRADRRGLSADGRLVLPRARIARALLEYRAEGVACVCAGPMGVSRTEVKVDSEEQGRRLLRALSFDASQRALRFAGPSPATTTPAGRTIAFTVVAALAVGELALLLALGHGFLTPLAIVLWSLQMWLVAGGAVYVGTDGLLLRSPWSRRFLRYEDIERVEAQEKRARLLLRDGEWVDLWLGLPGYGPAWNGSARTRDALVGRIIAAIGERSARAPLAPAAGLVARDGRTLAEWLEHLRRLVDASGTSYRTSAIEREQLWRIAEDANAPAASRAGAAVALRIALKPEERARLRVAAEAAAAPEVRAALEAVADEDVDEPALLRVLEPIGRGPSRREAARRDPT
jgi:hypothetical protein